MQPISYVFYHGYICVAHIIYLHKDRYSRHFLFPLYCSSKTPTSLDPGMRRHLQSLWLYSRHESDEGPGFPGGTHDSTGHGVLRNWWSFYWGKKSISLQGTNAFEWKSDRLFLLILRFWKLIQIQKLYFRNHTKEKSKIVKSFLWSLSTSCKCIFHQHGYSDWLWKDLISAGERERAPPLSTAKCLKSNTGGEGKPFKYVELMSYGWKLPT